MSEFKLQAPFQKPTLVIAHNKTLAAQLYGEYKEMFPENAMEFFVPCYIDGFYNTISSAKVNGLELYEQHKFSVMVNGIRRRGGSKSNVVN